VPVILSARAKSHRSGTAARRLPVRFVATALPVMLLAVGAGVVARARVPDSQIAPGIQVSGIELGGKSLEEARTALMKWAKTRLETQIKLHFAPEVAVKKSWKPTAIKLGLGIDVAATLDAAAKGGREGMLTQVSHLFSAPGVIAIPAKTTVDEAVLSAYLKQIAVAVNRKPASAKLVLTGWDSFSIQHDKPGIRMDKEASAATIARGWETFNRGSAAAPAFGTTETPAATPAVPTESVSAGDENVQHQKPGKQPVTSDQKTENKEATKKSADKNQNSEADELEAEMTIAAAPAATTYTDLSKINGLLGSFQTYVKGTESRNSNVALAASHINGRLLKPGEIFSYNKTVGQRRLDNGFKLAHEIVHGQLKDGIGGGICQVSSTLFNAVLKANLRIVTRSNHAFPVGYVPDGRDATVDWGNIDFQFQNDTDSPVYIVGANQSRKLTFRIFGQKTPGQEVTLVQVKKSSSDGYPIYKVNDPSLPVGHREVKEKGHPDIRVTWERVVKRDGQVAKREPIVTHYHVIPATVIVGTRSSIPRVHKAVSTPPKTGFSTMPAAAPSTIP